jgi:hypothetical protein
MRQDGLVSAVTRLRSRRARNHGLIPGRGKIVLSSAKCSDRLCGGNQPLTVWVPGVLSLELRRQGVKLTTRLHLVPKITMSGAIPPLSHDPS